MECLSATSLINRRTFKDFEKLIGKFSIK